MDSLESVKKYLSCEGGDAEKYGSAIASLPSRFFERFIMRGIHVDHIEPGRVLCSMKVPSRLLNAGNFMHGGAIATLVDLVGSAVLYTLGATQTGVSVEINVSYMDAANADEEIEIEAKSLRVGKAIAVVNVEFRKKHSGKLLAQGRHTKYLGVGSKL